MDNVLKYSFIISKKIKRKLKQTPKKPTQITTGGTSEPEERLAQPCKQFLVVAEASGNSQYFGSRNKSLGCD